jgi:hypothetical protein
METVKEKQLRETCEALRAELGWPKEPGGFFRYINSEECMNALRGRANLYRQENALGIPHKKYECERAGFVYIPCTTDTDTDTDSLVRELEMARLQLRIMQLENLLGIA